MKTLWRKFAVLSITVLLTVFSLSGQVPQKFNYQAVVRNTDGTVIADQLIGIQVSIIKDSPGGTVMYTETHTPTTSSLGLVTLMIGTGNTGDDFSSVDWGSGDHYLKVEVDPSGGTAYQEMSNAQLLSVPYALHALDVENDSVADADADATNEIQQLQLDGSNLSISGGNQVTLPTVATTHWNLGAGDTNIYKLNGYVGIGTDAPSGKLEVMGNTSLENEEPLFEVTRSDGKPVFAVYNEGVRIYVDDSGAKGAKGGFAVGGISALTKGFNEYLRVTPDSVRIYVDTTSSGKGSKGGFAIGGISKLTKGPMEEYLRVTPDSVRIYINQESAKGAKGGFAIGGIGPVKGPMNDFMRITPENYFIGQESGASITDGLYNSFMGFQSGVSTTVGDANIFLGYQSGYSNVSGETNTFIGNSAGFMNDDGYANVFIGDSVGFKSNGNWNIFIGNNAGFETTTGSANVALGDMAGYSNDDGWFNVFMGDLAGFYNSSGSSNVFIGSDAGFMNEIHQNGMEIITRVTSTSTRKMLVTGRSGTGSPGIRIFRPKGSIFQI